MSPTPELCTYIARWGDGACGSDVQALAPLIGIVVLFGVYKFYKRGFDSRREKRITRIAGVLGVILIVLGLFPTVEYAGGRNYTPEIGIVNGSTTDSGEVVLRVRNTGQLSLNTTELGLQASYNSSDLKSYEEVSSNRKVADYFRCSTRANNSIVHPLDEATCYTGLKAEEADKINIAISGRQVSREVASCQFIGEELKCS